MPSLNTSSRFGWIPHLKLSVHGLGSEPASLLLNPVGHLLQKGLFPSSTVQSNQALSKPPQPSREHIDWIEQKWTHRIEYLSKLEPDWDGYGAKAISEDAIAQCQQILAETAQVPRHRLLQLFIAPLSNGGLELEWDSPSGNELMTVIPPDEGPLEYLSTILDSTGEKVEKDGTIPGDATLSALLDQVSE